MELFNLRMEVTRNIKSKSWSGGLVKSVKSPDSHGLNDELFRPEVIGKDLLASLLMLCNNVKSQLSIPDFLTYTDITSFHKNKGAKNDLENDRGIFSVSKIRSIIDKLVLQDSNEIIDSHMSGRGGRRRRNIRDNLFTIYACVNEAIRSKKDIDIQFYDIQKCFDAMKYWKSEKI